MSSLLNLQAAAATAVKTHLGLDIRPPNIDFNLDGRDKHIPYHWALTQKYGYKLEPAQTRLVLDIIKSQREQGVWTAVECAEMEKLIVNKALVPVYNDAIKAFHSESIPLPPQMDNSPNFNSLSNTDQTAEQSQALTPGSYYMHSDDFNIEETIDNVIRIGRESSSRSLQMVKNKAGQLVERDWKEIYEFLRDTMIGLNRGLDNIKYQYTARVPPMFVTEDHMNLELRRAKYEWEREVDELSVDLTDREAHIHDLYHALESRDEALDQERAYTNKLETKIIRLQETINIAHKEIFSQIEKRQESASGAGWTEQMYVDMLEHVLSVVTAMKERSKKIHKGNRAQGN
ncbi:hypothetical protein TWF696_009644 [Orbilia brochopaga]|uniref:Uncharacterized protein n=1 Tax=Orbilia brochopaga TaxID=3140254 RepID=A0AAV9UBW4_9PEZI